MKEYLLSPMDVLFFRGNKAFHYGQWRTDGIFPPLPSTFQGFVRSKILEDSGFLDVNGYLTSANIDNAKNIVGDDNEMKIDLTGPFLFDHQKNSLFIKTPSDLIKGLNGYTSFLKKFTDKIESDLGFDISVPDLPVDKLEYLTAPDAMSLESLNSYRISFNELSLSTEPLWVKEERVGIEINSDKNFNEKNKQVSEAKYFVTPYVRINSDISIYFSIKQDNIILKNNTCKIGSESHLVYLSSVSLGSLLTHTLSSSRGDVIKSILSSRSFRLVFLQPGISKNGWFPFDNFEIVGKKFIANVDNLKLELVFAAINSPVKISGYSFRDKDNQQSGKQIERKAKGSVHAVPAGSVYFFNIIDCNDEKLITSFINKYDGAKIPFPPYDKMGFNQVAFAVGSL